MWRPLRWTRYGVIRLDWPSYRAFPGPSLKWLRACPPSANSSLRTLSDCCCAREGSGEATAVETFASGATRPTVALAHQKDRTWITRQGMHVVACAWLIRRFIDRGARFKFVSGKGYAPSLGELRFDVFEAEVTHMGGVLERSHRTQPCADLTSRIRRPYYGNERNDLRVFPESLTGAVTRSACPKCGCQLRSIQRKYNAFKSR